MAAAQLQGDLAGVAAAMGGEVTTVRILEPEEVAPFARIGLRLSVVGDTATVRDFLYAVETREPMLIVRRMELSNGAAQADNSPETLRLRPPSRSTATPRPPSCIDHLRRGR